MSKTTNSDYRWQTAAVLASGTNIQQNPIENDLKSNYNLGQHNKSANQSFRQIKWVLFRPTARI